MISVTVFGHNVNIRIILIASIVIGSGIVIGILVLSRNKKADCRPQDNDPANDHFEVEMCKLRPLNAVNCGESMFGGSLMPVIPTTIDGCVLDAFQKQQPVILRFTTIRMDRIDYTGLIATSNGNVTIIQYTWAIGNQVDVKVNEQHCTKNQVILDDVGNLVCMP